MRVMVTMMTIRTTFGDICHLYSSWMLLLNHLEAPHKLMVWYSSYQYLKIVFMNVKSVCPNCENAQSRKFFDNLALTDWVNGDSVLLGLFQREQHSLNLQWAATCPCAKKTSGKPSLPWRILLFTNIICLNSFAHNHNLLKNIFLSKIIILSPSKTIFLLHNLPLPLKKSLGVHKQNLHDAHQQRISWQRCFKWVSDVCSNWTLCSMISFSRWVCLIDFAFSFSVEPFLNVDSINWDVCQSFCAAVDPKYL